MHEGRGHTSFVSRNKKDALKDFKPKQKRWSHQDELDAAKGRKIQITFNQTAMPLEGIVAEADQFTIKIIRPGYDQSPLTVFKGSILFFRIVG